MLEVLVRPMLQRVEKCYKDSRTCHFGEFLRVHWLEVCQYILPSKKQIVASCIPYHKEVFTGLGSSLYVLEQHIPYLGILLQPIYQVVLKISSFVAQNRRRALQKVQAPVQASLPLGPIFQ